MKILIFVSKQHLYANYILGQLIKNGRFSGHTVVVFEQDGIVPGKTKLQGLGRYIRISGLQYVLTQAAKQWIFAVRQILAIARKNESSLYFPYDRLTRGKWKISLENDLKSDHLYARIKKIRPDLIISVYSKLIIPERIVSVPSFGAVNLHPALLPQYRGVSPVFWALANKESTVGSTLHYISAGIDTGEVITQSKISTQGYASEHALYLKLSVIGATLMSEFLSALTISQRRVQGSTMNVKNGAYYSLPTKKGVKKFRDNGYKFFFLSEFIR